MKTILIVDDEEMIVEIIEESLSEFRIFTALNGEKACSILRSERIDCVLCDLSLGDMSGIDVYHVAKSLTPSPQFIFLTGGVNNENHLAFFKKENPHTLEKPISIADIRKKIKSVLCV